MRILLTFCLVFLTVLPAAAQSKRDMVAKDAELEQRVYTLENRFLTGDPAAERLLRRMDALEAQQRAQEGEIEQLRYEREALRKDVKILSEKVERYEAVATRMRQHLDAVDLAATKGTPIIVDAPAMDAPVVLPAPAQTAPAAGEMGSSVIDTAELQTIGRDKLLAGDFAGAELAFRQYIDINPDATDVADAYFWLGESYLVRNGFPDASTAYIQSMKKAPKGQYAPRALVGLAAALRGMDNKSGACQALDTFPVQFPNAGADVKAKAKAERARAGC
ncbi:hypothetical protein [Robiginitomaculum antarcticum]|uniref:hypothetical protein n=1 Tax=Robiginitomaculum antarcticum TaxID=437507 RepID=UPI00037EE671|nr:hypothetical protein [Robiginitomaculum antarcticum]